MIFIYTYVVYLTYDFHVGSSADPTPHRDDVEPESDASPSVAEEGTFGKFLIIMML